MTKEITTPKKAEIDGVYFAGGGGSSEGYRKGLGIDVDFAVNHAVDALCMHQANYPGALHFTEDVFEFDILGHVLRDGRPVRSVWFSPDCKHFSKAKGGALLDKRIRGLAWVMCKVAGVGGGRLEDGGRGPACPRVMFLENVEEFPTWGPLIAKRCPKTGRVVKSDGTVAEKGERVPVQQQWLVPDAKRKGKYYRELLRDLRKRGATSIEEREIAACDYGAPTIRKRFYLIVRFDGKPIRWPEPTHGAPESPAVRSGQIKPHVWGANCIDFTLPCHSILFLSPEEARKLKIKRPLVENSNRRIAKGTDRYVIKTGNPFLVNLTHHGSDRNEPLDEPFRTITGANRGEKALIAPFVAYAQHGGAVRPVVTPIHTIAASTKDQNQMCVAFIARQFKTGICHAIDKPLNTVMADGGGGKNMLVSTFLARDFGDSVGSVVDGPMGAVMPGGMGKTKLVTFLAQNNTGLIGHSSEEPISTICGRGTNQALIACALVKYYGTDQDPRLNEPLHAVTTKDRFGLEMAALGIPPLTPDLAEKARVVVAFLRKYGVEIEGEFATVAGTDLVIYDIGMRMLEPRELFLAQGFPPEFVIEPMFQGKRLSRTAQIRMCGNSVSPPPAAAIIAANLGDEVEVEAAA